MTHGVILLTDYGHMACGVPGSVPDVCAAVTTNGNRNGNGTNGNYILP